VPSFANPQNLNRYSYVLNNPLRYTDPTGHKACGDEEAFDCETGLLNHPSNDNNKGCGGSNKPCGGKSPKKDEKSKLEDLIRREIDRRFDPFIGWLPVGFDYASSQYPTEDYYAEQAYEQAGYNLLLIGSQNQNNPMTEDDWLNSDVDIEYIYTKGIRTRAPGHKFFLNYMNLDVANPSNYEANYLNALMATHPEQVNAAKNAYYEQLLFTNGSLQGAWEFLQMNIDVAGPDT
jgi:hypothetical protein